MAGSIEKRGKNTYRLVVSCGYNLDGKPAKHTPTDIMKFYDMLEMAHKLEDLKITKVKD